MATNEENGDVELYRRHRPRTFTDMLGQKAAIQQLTDLGKRGKIPHALLLTGPSGCGKTTAARILQRKLKCSNNDFIEMNSADFRGIDDVRAIRQQMGASPMGGEARIWLFDECHGATAQAQDAMLKLLEDTPPHVYFVLCTTDPGKLKKTIITRCTEIKFKAIGEADLKALILRTAKAEGVALDDEVVQKIAEVADGSGRKTMVLLHAVLGLEDKDDQLEAIEAGNVKGQAIEIYKALMYGKTPWKKMQEILSTIQEEPESIRHLVLACCCNILVKGWKGDPARAAYIISVFKEPFFDSKMAGLALACYDVLFPGK